MKYIGRLIKYGIGLEGTRGQGDIGDIVGYIGQNDVSFEDKVEKGLDTAAMGDIVTSNGTFVTKRWSEGDFTFDFGVNSIGYFLKSLLGSCTSNSMGNGVYQHIFQKTANNQHPSMVITAEEGNVNYLYKLAMLDTFVIDVKLGAIVSCVATFKTKKGETFTESVSSSYFSEEKFNSANAIFKIADARTGLTTADEICTKSFSITFKKNLTEDICLGSIDLDDILNQNFDIEGTMEFDYDDNTFKHLALSQTYKALSFSLKGSTEIATGKYNEFSVVLDRVSFTDFDRKKGNDEIVTQTVSFNAHNYSLFCTMGLQNKHTSY